MADPTPTTDIGAPAPPPSEGQTIKNPIGVPSDYKPPTHNIHGGSPYERMPGNVSPAEWSTPFNSIGGKLNPVVYTSGDEWTLVLSKSPQEIANLQAEMIKAGILDAKSVRPGTWDSTSAAAYRTVLAYANALGATPEEALNNLENNPKLGDQQSGASAPGPYQLTNPDASKRTLRAASESLLGSDLSEGEQAAFANDYQGQEKAAYAQLGKAQKDGTLTTTAAPDAATAAEDYINKHHLNDKISYGAASRMVDFFSMLGTP